MIVQSTNYLISNCRGCFTVAGTVHLAWMYCGLWQWRDFSTLNESAFCCLFRGLISHLASFISALFLHFGCRGWAAGSVGVCAGSWSHFGSIWVGVRLSRCLSSLVRLVVPWGMFSATFLRQFWFCCVCSECVNGFSFFDSFLHLLSSFMLYLGWVLGGWICWVRICSNFFGFVLWMLGILLGSVGFRWLGFFGLICVGEWVIGLIG